MEAFAPPEPKNYDMGLCVVLELVLLKGEEYLRQSIPPELLGILFKISDEHPWPHLFYREVPPG